MELHDNAAKCRRRIGVDGRGLVLYMTIGDEIMVDMMSVMSERVVCEIFISLKIIDVILIEIDANLV